METDILDRGETLLDLFKSHHSGMETYAAG